MGYWWSGVADYVIGYVVFVRVRFAGEGLAYLFCVWEFPGSNLVSEGRCFG